MDKQTQKFVYKKGEIGIEAILVKKDGNWVSQYMGDSEQRFINEGCTIFDSYDEVALLIEASQEKRLINNWVEITEEAYWDALEVLPPCRWEPSRCGIFYVSEAYTSNIHSFYIEHKKKFYTANRRISLSNYEIVKAFLVDLEKGDIKINQPSFSN